LLSLTGSFPPSLLMYLFPSLTVGASADEVGGGFYSLSENTRWAVIMTIEVLETLRVSIRTVIAPIREVGLSASSAENKKTKSWVSIMTPQNDACILQGTSRGETFPSFTLT